MHTTTDREADRVVLRFLAYVGMTVCRVLHDTAVMALVIPPQELHRPRNRRRSS